MNNKINDIPADILRKLNEHTSGGFILFYIDVDGNPQTIEKVDGQTLFRGLMSYIEDTVESVREIDKISRVTELHGDDEIEEL